MSEAPVAPVVVVDPRRSVLRTLLRSPVAVLCLVYLLVVVVVAVVAPIMLPDVASTYAGDLAASSQGPSSAHLLGTDDLGRDVMERLLVGTRITAVAVAEAVLVAICLGVPSGLVAGYFGRRVDRVISWLGDLMLSMPAIAMLLVVLAVFPGSTVAAMFALGAIMSPLMMRVVRSAALPLRDEPYIAAARVSGLSHRGIIVRHVTPRLGGAIIVQSSLMAGQALMAMSGLAFLGLIAEAPEPSWGGMVGDGFRLMVQQPWLIWPPGVVIALTVLALGLLGDTLRDATTSAWTPASSRGRRRTPGSRRASGRADVSRGTDSTGLLRVDDLTIVLNPSGDPRRVIDRVSFEVRPAESVALVGESGCGKSITALSILGLLPSAARVESGSIWFDGVEISALDEVGLRRVRGKRIGFVSQEPMVSLNPAFTVGAQLGELVRRHHGVSRRRARTRVLDLLRRVHLPDPETVAGKYPHELSGGMAQRVSIARALAGSPSLLIADEPTTALDVTVQAGILDVFRELQAEGMSVLFVTHDWGVAADMCDRAIVMYAGQVVERAALHEIVSAPRHPYTAALLGSDPHRAIRGDRLPTIPGTVPQPGAWPQGCHFGPRCGLATEACGETAIPLLELTPRRASRCIHVPTLEEKL